MPTYRLITIDTTQPFASEFAASDDVEAERVASRLVSNSGIELWCDNRLVVHRTADQQTEIIALRMVGKGT